MATTSKEDRINLRIDSSNKAVLEQAALLKNLSLSSYIISVCLNQAKLDIEANEVLVVNNQDRDLILNLLSNPSEPNDALKGLMET